MQDEKNNMLSNKIKIALKKKLKKAYIEFLNKEPLIKYIFIICFIIVYIFKNEYIEIDNEIQLYEKILIILILKQILKLLHYIYPNSIQQKKMMNGGE